MKCGLLNDKRFKEAVYKILTDTSKKSPDEALDFYIELLKTLRNLFSDEDFYDSLKDLLLNLPIQLKRLVRGNSGLSGVLSEDLNLKELIDPKMDTSPISYLREESKSLQLDENAAEKQEKRLNELSLISQYFPKATDAMLFFESKFKQEIVLDLFINTQLREYYYNTSNKDLDSSLKAAHSELEKKVDAFIDKYHSNKGFYAQYKTFKTLENKLNFLKAVKQDLILDSFTLLSFPGFVLLEDPNLREKLEGYYSLVAFLNFDDLISKSFGDAVNIRYQNNYSASIKRERKYSLNLGNRSARTWGDDDASRDSTQEIGSIIRNAVESLNIYRGDSKTALKLSFNEVTYTIGHIFSLIQKASLGSFNLDSRYKKNLEKIYSKKGLSFIETKIGDNPLNLIALAKLDPTMYAPVLFAFLDLRSLEIFQNDMQSISIVHSLYKNIFDVANTNSWLNIALRSANKYDYKTPDLYLFFLTLLINVEETPYMEYKEDVENGVEAVSIIKNIQNKKILNLKYIWNGYYNISNPQSFLTFTTSKIENRKLSINIKNTNYTITVESGNKVSVSHNGKKVKISTLFNSTNTAEIYSFLSEVFKFKIDDNYVNAYKDIIGESSLDTLIALAGKILYNYTAGKLMNATNSVEYNNQIEDYYSNENLPRSLREAFQPELFSNKDFVSVWNLVKVKDYIRGYGTQTTGKDGEGKQIALFGLSSLMGHYLELVHNYNKNTKDSVSRHFKLYDFYRGVQFVRDYNGLEQKQQATKFSHNEFFGTSFIYDFYGTEADQDSILRVMGPVISDKNKLPKILVDSKYEMNVDGRNISIWNLTTEQIHKIQQEEFGIYYQGVYDNIKKLWAKLTTTLKEIYPDFPGFDYDDDFTAANVYAENIGKTGATLMHEAIAAHQRKSLSSSTYDIKIIDGVSYIKDKKTGRIHNNPSLYHQLSIYGRPLPANLKIDSKYIFREDSLRETPEEAIRRRENNIISELLSKKIEIIVDSSNAGRRARRKNANFVTRNHIVLGKLKKGDETKNIITYENLENYYDYRELLKVFGDNIPAKFDVNNPGFDLLATIQRMNFAYLCRTLLMKESRNILVNEDAFISKLRTIVMVEMSDFEIIASDYRNHHPNWNEDKISTYTNNYLSDKSSEEITKRINNIIINQFVNLTILNAENIELLEEAIALLQNNADEAVLNVLMARLSDDNRIEFEINPEILRHNALNMWISEAYNLTSVGSFIAHPGDASSDTIFNFESSQIGLQIKRNVSQTATKHREVQNTLTGITPNLRQLIVDDESNSIITFKGDYDPRGAKLADGAMFFNMFMNDLDNNSLGSDAMGSDKKPFVHSYDPETGIGLIGKMAGFIISNARIRLGNSGGREGRLGLMNRILNDTIKWSDILRINGIEKGFLNYLTDTFHNKKLTVGPWFYYDNSLKSWVKAYNLTIDAEGNTSYQYKEVYSNGEEKNSKASTKQCGKIDSNYLLWKVFGGEYSASLQDGKLIYDDSSTKTVNYIMNNVGFVRNNALEASQIKSLANVLLVLKEAQIHMWTTAGAAKFGAVNTNSKEIYTNPEYLPTWMEFNSSDYGEQLDSEHDAEGGHVSLMTQVINALGARGYSREDSTECYEALESVILTEYKQGLDALTLENPNQLKLFIYNLIAKDLNRVEFSEGNILTALAQSLKNIKELLDLDSIQIGISDPRVFSILTSKVASAIEKSVRLKIDGGQYVLVPSDRNFPLIADGFASDFSIEELNQMQKNSKPLRRSAEIRFGRTYIIEGIENPIKVDSYLDFDTLRKFIQNGNIVKELFIIGDTPVTRDLAAYECIFYDLSGNLYTLWETDAVRRAFQFNKDSKLFEDPQTEVERLWNKVIQKLATEFEKSILNDWLGNSLHIPYSLDLLLNRIYEYSKIDLSKYLERDLLKTLNSIGSGTTNTTSINGEIIYIDKNKTEVHPYEAILPMMYKEEFGLLEGDRIDLIEKDKHFFTKRALNLYKSKVSSRFYDLELKVSNGNHIYIHDSSLHELNTTFLRPVEIEDTYLNGIRYRVIDGKAAYPIPEDLKIYESNGVEIFSTSKVEEILDNFEYDNIVFNNFSQELLRKVSISENDTAQYTVNKIVEVVKNRITNHKEGLNKGDEKLTILTQTQLSNGNTLAEEIQGINNIENIDINWIIGNEVGMNEFMHSDLFKRISGETQDEIIGRVLNALERGVSDEYLAEHPEARFLEPIIYKGIKKHTSFLTSLEAVVSRTPAQSHQSFMAMKIAGFGEGRVNSIYINRMLIYLQGSDYDIDKANVLGLKFLNGQLVVWSPYYDLSSKTTSSISENLPFPTGTNIAEGDMTKRAFDVNDKNYEYLIDTDNLFVIRDSDGNILAAIQNVSGKWNITGDLSYTNIRAALNKIPQNAVVTINNEVTNNLALGLINGMNTKNYNFNEDFKEYLESINGGNSLEDKVKLLRTAKKLKVIHPQYEREIRIINKHNTYLNKSPFRKRYALYNFISIKTKNISKNPINLIQGQSGIDVAVDKVKDAVNPRKSTNQKHTILSTVSQGYDGQSVISRIGNLILTLSGKLNTGIVASAMKTFEAMSLYYYNILAEGTEEELVNLLSDINILGKDIELLANSYTNNEDTIKNEDVKRALRKVNNLEDAFILMSALLSLSTDNAKDPTLSKYNADPQMIGLYISGIVLGVDMNTLRDLVLSKTGLLLASMTKSNILNPDAVSFKRASLAISYLKNPPKAYNISVYEGLIKAFQVFGFDKLIKLDAKGNLYIDNEELSSLLRSPSERRKIKTLASFLLTPDLNKLSQKDDDIIEDLINERYRDRRYWSYKRKESENNSKIEELNNKTSLSEKEKSKLETLQLALKDYIDISKEITALEEYRTTKKGGVAKNLLKTRRELILFLSGKNLDDLKKNINEDAKFKRFLRSIFDWSKKRDIIEKDIISNETGDYYIIDELDKLNKVNEEMGELRKVLALNLGLPNSFEDQLDWIRNFRTILETAIKRKGLDAGSKNFEVLRNLNNELFSEGKIDFNNPLWVDLNLFLNNPTYQKAVIQAYQKARVFVNIMDVMVNVPHYRGYLKAMNLLYEGLKASSALYREQARLGGVLLEALAIKDPKKSKLFFKDAKTLIYQRLNNEYLISRQVLINLPSFTIENGELVENLDEFGNTKIIPVRLGTEEGNKRFAEYMVYYILPFLKTNYPNNKFVELLTLRSYKFNLDHNITTNIAKSDSFNTENALEAAAFNKAKQGLRELQNVEGVPLVKYLFYYNLIAYNGQPGQQSLTDLFEDVVAFSLDSDITDYEKYIAERDRSEIPIFETSEYEDLMFILAPVVSPYDEHINHPVFYILDAETKKYKLCKKSEESQAGPIDGYDEDLDAGYDNPDSPDDSEEFYTPKSLETWADRMKRLKIEEVTAPSVEPSNKVVFDNYGIKNDIFKVVGLDKVSAETLLKNKDKITLIVKGRNVTLQQFIDIAKDLGWNELECLNIFKFKLSIKGKAKSYVLDLDILKSGLKTRSELKLENCVNNG